jgi:hypothetical protein
MPLRCAVPTILTENVADGDSPSNPVIFTAKLPAAKLRDPERLTAKAQATSMAFQQQVEAHLGL